MKKQSLLLVAGLALLTSACANLCEDDTCQKPCQKNEVMYSSGAPYLFAFDSATLTAKEKADLDKVAARLKADKDVTVTANGYADSTGPASYNVYLSQKRAAAVKAYLVEKGVAADRIAIKGYGATNPVATNETVAGRAKNRRVEVVVD